MHGNRTRLKQQLMREREELDRKREDEDTQHRREMVGIRQSSSVDVPNPANPPPTVNVEVPPTIREVRDPSVRLFC